MGELALIDLHKKEKETIYIINQDERFFNLFRNALGDQYQVEIISKKNQIFSVLDSVRPKAVFVGFAQNSLEDLTLVQHLRDHPSTSDLPIFIISDELGISVRNDLEKKGIAGIIKNQINPLDLKASVNSLMDGLNLKITSIDNKRKCVISCGPYEKRKEIATSLKESLQLGEKVVFLSWTTGESFCTEYPELLSAINEESLIFLEIKTSLIMKFPYLQSLAPVLSDINQFANYDKNKFKLVFDEPRNLYDVYDQERALSKTMSLSRLLHSAFIKTEVYMTATHSPEMKSFVSKLAKIFVGR